MYKLTALFIVMLSLNVFSLMPPWVYQELQDKADENIEIKVVSLSTDTIFELVPLKYVKTIDVFASAIVTKIEKSANNLVVRDTIKIGYRWTNNKSYYIQSGSGDTICVEKIGGGQAPVMKEDQASLAFLNYSDSLNVFQPAALGSSFSLVYDNPVNNSIPSNKYVNKLNMNRGITVLPNGKAINLNGNRTNNELAKGMYLQNGFKRLNLKGH